MNAGRRLIPPGAYTPPVAALDSGPLAAAALASLPASSPGTEWPAEVAIVDAFLPQSAEVPVYKTLRRWRGLDVYVDTTAAAFNSSSSVFSVGVYAISRGLRTLIATGRTRENRVGRLCSVRVPIAEAYEVTIAYGDLPASLREAVKVAVVATDCVMPAPDDGDGLIAMHFSNHLYAATPALTITGHVIPFTLIGINAFATVAGMFLHIHDTTSIVPATLNGRAPVFGFGLPNIGATVFGDDSRLLGAPRLLKGGFVLCGSSTGAVTTLAAAGEVVMGGFVR